MRQKVSAAFGLLLLGLASCSGQSGPAPGLPRISASPTILPSAQPVTEPAVPAPTATPAPALESPLTGLPVPGQDEIVRRPLLVKLGNSEVERPQSGLAQADVVYESLTEGGITRYAAVYQSRDATSVGPVRSARLSDLQVAPEFGAVLAHVGASKPIMGMLRSGSVLDLDQFFFQQYYHRITNRPMPYNVYTSTAALRAGAKDRGFSSSIRLAPYAFEQTVPAGGAVDTIDFDFAPETPVQYVYEPASHAYHEVEYGAATADAATGQPVAISNVVVQFTPVHETAIVEDQNGSHSLQYSLVGSGKVMVFHDGLEVDGTWRRGRLSDRTSFVDAEGEPIPLARGSVWIALVNPDTSVTVRGPAGT